MEDAFDVAVLGAGLAGACTALELAARGFDVALVERDGVPMNRASLRNEGKIHLGLIYANDPTMATARLQLAGALRFRAFLRRWLGEAAGGIAVSTPFSYVVARDSVLSPERLAGHYLLLEQLCREELASHPELDYMGSRPERLAWLLAPDEADPRLRSDKAQAVFGTAEVAIDTAHLAGAVRAALLAAPRIAPRFGRCVSAVHRAAAGFVVEGIDGAGETWRISARQVVNATWEQRFAIDRTVGIEHAPGWLHRLKYRVIARLPEALRGGPSMTIVIGRYGDVVVRPDGTAYLSWYPTGLRGWTHDPAPPSSWSPPCRGETDPGIAAEVVPSFLAGLEEWYRGVSSCEPFVVDAGAIVAYGKTDVDDARSGLHDRTRTGVLSADGYHSLDPGKLTTAPLFAMEAADRVSRVVAGAC